MVPFFVEPPIANTNPEITLYLSPVTQAPLSRDWPVLFRDKSKKFAEFLQVPLLIFFKVQNRPESNQSHYWSQNDFPIHRLRYMRRQSSEFITITETYHAAHNYCAELEAKVIRFLFCSGSLAVKAIPMPFEPWQLNSPNLYDPDSVSGYPSVRQAEQAHWCTDGNRATRWPIRG